MKSSKKIAYIMSRFPGLSETFILREMIELEKLGWSIDLYPIVYQNGGIVHDEASPWMKRARRPSFLKIIIDNLNLIILHPFLYVHILFQIIKGNIGSPKFLLRAIILFPISVWMAEGIKRQGVTLIHAHFATHPALAAWIINQITGIPYGLTVHAHDIYVDRSMLEVKLKGAHYIVSISQFNYRYLVDLFGEWVGDKIKIIHCGIFPEQYRYLMVERKIDVRPFTIISIGSLRSYKGFTFLLDACYLLKKKSIPFLCRIIGGGELLPELSAKIVRLGLEDDVELLGPKTQREVAVLLQNADCYVQPSIITSTGKMEGIPVSLMEAMASGLPVIATDISGIPELVRDGETGWLVPPENAPALSLAIWQVYNQKDKVMSCVRSGRELVYKEFNIYHTVAELSRLFEEVCESDKWK